MYLKTRVSAVSSVRFVYNRRGTGVSDVRYFKDTHRPQCFRCLFPREWVEAREELFATLTLYRIELNHIRNTFAVEKEDEKKNGAKLENESDSKCSRSRSSLALSMRSKSGNPQILRLFILYVLNKPDTSERIRSLSRRAPPPFRAKTTETMGWVSPSWFTRRRPSVPDQRQRKRWGGCADRRANPTTRNNGNGGVDPFATPFRRSKDNGNGGVGRGGFTCHVPVFSRSDERIRFVRAPVVSSGTCSVRPRFSFRSGSGFFSRPDLDPPLCPIPILSSVQSSILSQSDPLYSSQSDPLYSPQSDPRTALQIGGKSASRSGSSSAIT